MPISFFFLSVDTAKKEQRSKTGKRIAAQEHVLTVMEETGSLMDFELFVTQAWGKSELDGIPLTIPFHGDKMFEYMQEAVNVRTCNDVLGLSTVGKLRPKINFLVTGGVLTNTYYIKNWNFPPSLEFEDRHAHEESPSAPKTRSLYASELQKYLADFPGIGVPGETLTTA